MRLVQRVAPVLFVAGLSSAFGQGEIHEISVAGSSGVGAAVCGVGDINADGFDDFAVTKTSPRAVLVYSGLDASVLHSVAWGGIFGFGDTLAGIGDVNLDGVPDLAVGAPQADTVVVLSGKNAGVIWQTVHPTPKSHFGSSIAAAGDIDQDGRTDVAVAASGGAVVQILSGATGAVLRTKTLTAAPLALSGNADVNLDGIPDVLIGLGTVPGQLVVISGKDASQLLLVTSTDSQEHLGWSVAFLDDVDGDNVPDLVAGAQGYQNVGRVGVFSGQTGQLLYQLVGNKTSGAFGLSVAGVADFDFDGVGDLLVACDRDAYSTMSYSTITGFSARTGGAVFKIESTDSNDGFGRSMIAAGDVNGDGYQDFIAGEPLATPILPNCDGLAHVYSPVCGLKSYTDTKGCPGSGGIVPKMQIGGCVTPLCSAFIEVNNTVGNTLGLLVVDSSFPGFGGCSISIKPSSILLPIPVNGFPGPGNGSFGLDVKIPASMPLTWFYLRAYILDPGAVSGVSATNLVSVRAR